MIEHFLNRKALSHDDDEHGTDQTWNIIAKCLSILLIFGVTIGFGFIPFFV
jgi:hypothetical protein